MNNLLIRSLNVLTYLTMLVIYAVVAHILARTLVAAVATVGAIALLPAIFVYAYIFGTLFRKDIEFTSSVYRMWTLVFNSCMSFVPAKPTK